jgi:hypothetical protein
MMPISVQERLRAPARGAIGVAVGDGVLVGRGVGDAVAVLDGVGLAVLVGLGVDVALGVAVALDAIVGVALAAGEGVPVGAATCVEPGRTVAVGGCGLGPGPVAAAVGGASDPDASFVSAVSTGVAVDGWGVGAVLAFAGASSTSIYGAPPSQHPWLQVAPGRST